MASTNLETIQRLYEAFNDRRYDDAAGLMAEGGVYQDRARGLEFHGRDEFIGYMKSWVSAFSDARITEPQYVDAGDVVVTEFRGRGTNDGNLGTFPPTNQTMEVPFCEVIRFDESGYVTEVHAYFDVLTMLGQLGHLQPPPEATEVPAPERDGGSGAGAVS